MRGGAIALSDLLLAAEMRDDFLRVEAQAVALIGTDRVDVHVIETRIDECLDSSDVLLGPGPRGMPSVMLSGSMMTIASSKWDGSGRSVIKCCPIPALGQYFRTNPASSSLRA